MAITVEHLDSIVRLQQLERRLRYMAFTWSRDAPSAQEDLEQVARVAVWEELRLHPDAPDQNLLARAKRAIWRERLRGRSVDGRLNLNGRRPQSYTILSLEAPRPGDLPPLDEMLGSGPVHAHDV
ncbi:MAG: hypothetical protein FJ088_15715, partial [Deltaproteobacteria bacterium]|nr:hypothetical protein [Deltaproteobacteria bacterium]